MITDGIPEAFADTHLLGTAAIQLIAESAHDADVGIPVIASQGLIGIDTGIVGYTLDQILQLDRVGR